MASMPPSPPNRPRPSQSFAPPTVLPNLTFCWLASAVAMRDTRVAGEAALYVGEVDVAGLKHALQQVQEPTRRADLSKRGRAQVVQFTWSAMAETIAEEFIAGIDRLRRGDLPRPAPLWGTMRAMQ